MIYFNEHIDEGDFPPGDIPSLKSQYQTCYGEPNANGPVEIPCIKNDEIPHYYHPNTKGRKKGGPLFGHSHDIIPDPLRKGVRARSPNGSTTNTRRLKIKFLNLLDPNNPTLNISKDDSSVNLTYKNMKSTHG